MVGIAEFFDENYIGISCDGDSQDGTGDPHPITHQTINYSPIYFIIHSVFLTEASDPIKYK